MHNDYKVPKWEKRRRGWTKLEMKTLQKLQATLFAWNNVFPRMMT